MYSKAFAEIIVEKSYMTYRCKHKILILRKVKKIQRYNRAINRKRKTATEHKTTWYYCARLQQPCSGHDPKT